MEKGKKKFQQEKDENNNENIQNLMKENVLNAYEFTKPEQTAMKFGGYSGRENEGFEKEKKNFIIKILKNVDSKKK